MGDGGMDWVPAQGQTQIVPLGVLGEGVTLYQEGAERQSHGGILVKKADYHWFMVIGRHLGALSGGKACAAFWVKSNRTPDSNPDKT